MAVRAIVHKAEEGGFWAEVPSIPGCATQGETMEELVPTYGRQLRDAYPFRSKSHPPTPMLR